MENPKKIAAVKIGWITFFKCNYKARYMVELSNAVNRKSGKKILTHSTLSLPHERIGELGFERDHALDLVEFELVLVEHVTGDVVALQYDVDLAHFHMKVLHAGDEYPFAQGLDLYANGGLVLFALDQATQQLALVGDEIEFNFRGR